MRGEGLGNGAGLLLFLRLYLFKEGYFRFRVISSGVGVLHAEIVGLRFKAAREFHKGKWQADLRNGAGGISDTAADEDERQRCDVGPVAACLLAHGMTSADVSSLMRHH